MMKKLQLLIILLGTFLLTGCVKMDKMDDIKIVTSVYPITNLTEKIYGDNSNVMSIYPNGINVDEYEITDKQIKEYSKSDLFIYNGLDSREKKIATRLLNANKDIKLIDASQGLTINSSKEELWLSPSNYLMLAQNIKEHLKEEISSTVLKNDVEKNYEKIKLTISTFDAQFKIIAENASDKEIIVANNSLKFLSKYGFVILSLDKEENKLKSNITAAKNKLNSKENGCIFAIDGILDENIKGLTSSITNVKSMTNLSVDDVKENNSYETMMNEFIESLRTEVY
ncbi:MAG: metal ABC transporter substrate-binding protein [Bacilli bacterium]|nr:metal ABC transporter substrate-binding protein [Bacilli bacterium]